MAGYNDNNSDRTRRKSASEKIAEERRQKANLNEFSSPRLNNKGNNMPRLTARTNGQALRSARQDGKQTPAVRSKAGRKKAPEPFPGVGERIYTKQKAEGKPLFNKKGSNGGKIVAITVIVILALIAFLLLTSKNGVEVFVDGNSIGVVLDKTYNADYIKETCTAKLVSSLGTNVEITSEISAKKVHAGKNDDNVSTGDYLLKNVNDALKYNVEATAININGSEIAVVSNDEAAQTVADRILSEHKLSYIEDTSSIVEGPEIEGLEFTHKFVDGTEILSNDQAYEKMNATKEEKLTYTVVSGDSFGKIAARYGLSVAELMESNPDIGDTTRISVGDEIAINATVPILDIKVVTQTVDRSSGTAVIVKTTYINGSVENSETIDSAAAKADSAEDDDSAPSEDTAPDAENADGGDAA